MIKTLAPKISSISDRIIKIGQEEIAYKDEGNGETLLCLHPVGHSSKDFQCLYDTLTDSYRIIAVDFPGHGNSAPVQGKICASYFSQIIQEFTLNLAPGSFTIIGNSIGGAVGIRLAHQNPKIKALVLANPGGLDKRGWLFPVFMNFMIRFFKKGTKAFPSFQQQFANYYSKILPSEKAMERRQEIIDCAYDLAPLLVEAWTGFKEKSEDLRPLIHNIDCPVFSTVHK